MSNEHLEQRERRDVIVAAGGWPVREPEQTEDATDETAARAALADGQRWRVVVRMSAAGVAWLRAEGETNPPAPGTVNVRCYSSAATAQQAASEYADLGEVLRVGALDEVLAPLALGSRARPRTDAPAVLDESPWYAGGVFYASLDDAARARELLAARQARDEARRRAYLSAFPSQLDDIREGLDAVAAQDWADVEAA